MRFGRFAAARFFGRDARAPSALCGCFPTFALVLVLFADFFATMMTSELAVVCTSLAKLVCAGSSRKMAAPSLTAGVPAVTSAPRWGGIERESVEHGIFETSHVSRAFGFAGCVRHGCRYEVGCSASPSHRQEWLGRATQREEGQ